MEPNYRLLHRPTRRDFIRGIGVAAGALTLAPAIAACRAGGKRSGTASSAGPGRPVRGGTLTSSLNFDPQTLDYASFGNDGPSKGIIADCVEPLLTVDLQGQPAPLLATSWENPDDHTYVFKLRQGVTFQDGTDFNSGAVEYSMGRIRSNKASFQYPQLVYIDKLEKPDQATVKLTLSSPFAPLLYSLADHPGRVISPAIGEKYGDDRLKVDLTNQGTGPFKFVEWKAGDHVTLVRNERYWGSDAFGTQLPYADKLVYRIIPDANQALASLRNGEIDALQLAAGGGGGGTPARQLASVKADQSLSYRDQPGTAVHSLFFNESKQPFGSSEVRKAISFAIDRAAIDHAVFFDTAPPIDVIFTPAIWTYDDAYHPYPKRNLTKAKQLLAQASRPNGFACTLMVRDIPQQQQAAELIKDQLRELAVNVTVQGMDQPALLAAARRGEHQFFYGVPNPGLDPDSWIYVYFNTKGGSNAFTRYNNPDVDRLLEQARTTLDAAARKPLYQQAQRLIMDDAAVCAMYTPTAGAVSRANVHNVPLGPTPAEGASQVWKSS